MTISRMLSGMRARSWAARARSCLFVNAKAGTPRQRRRSKQGVALLLTFLELIRPDARSYCRLSKLQQGFKGAGLRLRNAEKNVAEIKVSTPGDLTAM